MSEAVKKMFSRIANDYDRMNSILSLGIHHRWRKVAADKANLQDGMKILDCATGTGDLAIAFANRLNGQSEVIGMDFNEDMMAIAKQKAAKEGKKIKFETGDVMALNYPDNYFDLASISFGIRNVDNPKKGLSEMARVVKPGGKVLVLEFGQPDDWFKIPYNFYNKFIPTIGKMIAKDKSAYTYLPNTTQRFPAGDKFVKIMQETDKFSDIYCKKLTHGVCYLYIGIVK